jgi:hypothetical protein
MGGITVKDLNKPGTRSGVFWDVTSCSEYNSGKSEYICKNSGQNSIKIDLKKFGGYYKACKQHLQNTGTNLDKA